MTNERITALQNLTLGVGLLLIASVILAGFAVRCANTAQLVKHGREACVKALSDSKIHRSGKSKEYVGNWSIDNINTPVIAQRPFFKGEQIIISFDPLVLQQLNTTQHKSFEAFRYGKKPNSILESLLREKELWMMPGSICILFLCMGGFLVLKYITGNKGLIKEREKKPCVETLPRN